MAGVGPFYVDAEIRAKRRNRQWYQNNIITVLQDNKEKQVRGVDTSIVLAKTLLGLLDEKVQLPKKILPHDVVPCEDDSLMKPVEPKLKAMFYKSTEKGGGELYLKARNKMAPDDKFFFRICSNWDYGWQQKQSRIPARDVNRGRCAILRETFYRKNNLAPDPPYYAEPAGAGVGICNTYTCNFSNPKL